MFAAHILRSTISLVGCEEWLLTNNKGQYFLKVGKHVYNLQQFLVPDRLVNSLSTGEHKWPLGSPLISERNQPIQIGETLTSPVLLKTRFWQRPRLTRFSLSQSEALGSRLLEKYSTRDVEYGIQAYVTQNQGVWKIWKPRPADWILPLQHRKSQPQIISPLDRARHLRIVTT